MSTLLRFPQPARSASRGTNTLGSVFTGLGVPSLILGIIAFAGNAEELGLVLGANGVILTGVGIGLLAAHQPNSVLVSPLTATGARSAVRISGLGVAAAPTRTGALASLRVAF